MKRVLMLVAVLILIIIADRYFAYYQSGRETKTIRLSFDIGKEREVQAEVDKGHQPWRLEPVDAAHSALLNQGINIPVGKCGSVSEADREAIVRCTDIKKNYTVKLRQLIRAKGIWTATEIEVGE